MENLEETQELASELDQLLKQAVERQEALKMPRPKLHWKQAKQRRLEARRKRAKRKAQVEYVERQKRSLRYKYMRLRWEIRHRGIEWDLSLDDWLLMWLEAKPTKDGQPAWMARGKGKDAAKVRRVDTERGYSKDNLQIEYQKEVLWP